MTTTPNQRWREGRTSYRPPDEVINTLHYEVETLSDPEAKLFVQTHHYSHSYPSARSRFGLFRRGELVGCAVFSYPMSDKAVTNVFTNPARNSIDLGRFVLLDDVPGNGETWMLARCFELIKRNGVNGDEISGVVSFSDPLPRVDKEGRITHRGHIGTIYQAHNGVYLGQSGHRTCRILPDGTVMSPRAMQKIRDRSKGFDYSARRLQAFGADSVWSDSTAWLNHWLDKLTVSVRHPGMHKYAWALNQQTRKQLPRSLPYPKIIWGRNNR